MTEADDQPSPGLTPADLTPGSLGWRVAVAVGAHSFFKVPQDPDVAAAIGKTIEPKSFDTWSVADFSEFCHTRGLQGAGNLQALTQIIGAMQRAGFLVPFGAPLNIPIMGERYLTQGGASPGQVGGNLWLSEVFGAELIIPSYNAVTIQLCGRDAEGNESARWGSGLVLDRTHIVTNKHVVNALVGSQILEIHPSSRHSTAPLGAPCTGVAHPELDVAVIEIDLPPGTGLPGIVGMAFRDPAWADEVYLFGYPHVPMIAGMALTVQRGEVVNPLVETPATDGHDRQKTFLYSAIARPGNSGGPIVAHDGRVIGLVVEDSAPAATAGEPSDDEDRIDRLEREVADLKAKAFAPAFYRGIPSSEIIRALGDLGFGGLAKLDEPQVLGSNVNFQKG